MRKGWDPYEFTQGGWGKELLLQSVFVHCGGRYLLPFKWLPQWMTDWAITIQQLKSDPYSCCLGPLCTVGICTLHNKTWNVEREVCTPPKSRLCKLHWGWTHSYKIIQGCFLTLKPMNAITGRNCYSVSATLQSLLVAKLCIRLLSVTMPAATIIFPIYLYLSQRRKIDVYNLMVRETSQMNIIICSNAEATWLALKIQSSTL